ncbi:HAD family hydrolase [Clostridium tagluense]|uniref:HAD family hydrolase n=1 Tax=Clostridium tagluense TaxID=360422 RepID=UPI001C6E2EAA|nr:HAD hydrolase-like protein [Clostridium tagluense]MBW9155747.1 HAD hydrolase-like protein [Clostridium tagluense]WLC65344.1 HAD hydrolase-like protein [Clostridium tagluense]
MNILKSGYKHIIWDWNGTLLDDVEVVINVMNSLLQKRKMPVINKEIYLQIFDFPVINYYTKLGFNFSLEPFEKIANEYVELYRTAYRSCNLQQDAQKILKLVSDSDITQSILSASQQIYLDESIDFYKINDFFVKLVGLNDHYAVSKVENGKMLLQDLSLNPKEVLLIGDTVHDYEVSKAIGCDCFLVACGHQHLDKFKNYDVPVYNSLSDLIL